MGCNAAHCLKVLVGVGTASLVRRVSPDLDIPRKPRADSCFQRSLIPMRLASKEYLLYFGISRQWLFMHCCDWALQVWTHGPASGGLSGQSEFIWRFGLMIRGQCANLVFYFATALLLVVLVFACQNPFEGPISILVSKLAFTFPDQLGVSCNWNVCFGNCHVHIGG
ncbi:hypothetical protein F4825DRAFT_328708 [Nemania diffusa]|nr:hypothetical protein F4825DRAFT_328708 [Nemania diffusa]